MLTAGSVGHGAVPNDVSSPQVKGVLPLVLPSFHFGCKWVAPFEVSASNQNEGPQKHGVVVLIAGHESSMAMLTGMACCLS
jgi:hypothetical protein